MVAEHGSHHGYDHYVYWQIFVNLLSSNNESNSPSEPRPGQHTLSDRTQHYARAEDPIERLMATGFSSQSPVQARVESAQRAIAEVEELLPSTRSKKSKKPKRTKQAP